MTTNKEDRIKTAQTVKQSGSVGMSGAAFCPVKCPACRNDPETYKAHWRHVVLALDEVWTGFDAGNNRILFLLEGALQIQTRNGGNYDLSAGHCVFLDRNAAPVVTATAATRAVRLEFSNRVMFRNRDSFAGLALTEKSMRIDMPVLPILPAIGRLIRAPFLNNPCFHLLKQYELFLMMRTLYSDEELAVFFRTILQPAHDLRAFVMSNYREATSVEDFALKAHMSVRTFQRRFRDAFGITVHHWLVKQRVRDLWELILAGERDTRKLARCVAATDTSGLYQFCRLYFGCSISVLFDKCNAKDQ